MVPPSLDVETHQVQPELLPVLLEQMVRQLGGEGSVQLLRLLGGQTPHEGLHRVVVIQVVRGKLGLSEGHRLQPAAKYVEALNSSRYQTVSEPSNRRS